MSDIDWDALLEASQGKAPGAWLSAQQSIAECRQQVEEFLRSGGQAYGFSTLFGHLDKYRCDVASVQHDLLDAHLVGRPQALTLAQMRGITTIKVCQLSLARNGISLGTYQTLIEQFDGLTSPSCCWLMDFSASYGSGDVVPAAWWVRSLLGEVAELPCGDVMSLINGSFIAAGLALADYLQWDKMFVLALEMMTVAQHIIGKSDVQAAVSLRDIEPLQHSCDMALQLLRQEIVHCATTASGNPLFRFVGERFEAESNSSFLSFAMTRALRGMAEAMATLASYLRSAIAWLCRLAEQREGELIHGAFFIQPAKVSKAYADQAQVLAGMRFPVAQAESYMIEDIGDGSLLAWNALQPLFEIVSVQASLLDQVIRALTGPVGLAHRFVVDLARD